MKNKDELEKLKLKIIQILKKRGIKKAGIFGSFARGEQTKKSDIDILVTFDHSIHHSYFDFINIKDDFQNTLGREVDLVEKESLRNPFRKAMILSSAMRIYAA